MSQESKKIVWVCGVYNWDVKTTKEERHKNKNYDRYNWCDIDTIDIKYYESVIQVFKNHKVSCIGQRCGKGYHVWGDLVPFDLWLQIWDEIRPFADPRWAPHTLRISKKRPNEIWEKAIFYDNSNSGMKPWMKSLLHFLGKELREENSTHLKKAMQRVGLNKYFECPVYPVEITI